MKLELLCFISFCLFIITIYLLAGIIPIIILILVMSMITFVITLVILMVNKL
jgi:hypothetical protein